MISIRTAAWACLLALPTFCQLAPADRRGDDEGQLAPRSTLTRSPSIAASQPLSSESAPAAFDAVLQGTGSGYDVLGRPVLVGPDYRFVFTDEGAAYHPAFGSAVEQVQELTFDLLGIDVGGEPLLVVGGEVTARLDGERATLDRGAGILERYDARLDGVEQTFVLRDRPAAHGDLVVRGRLTSSMPFLEATDAGLAFGLEGVGRTTLGTVTGIDAAGRTVPGELRFDGTTVEYVLPAAFVASATYPLVVDPLIGSESTVSAGWGTNQFRPDAAWEASSGQYLVVWDAEYALGDYDVHARRVNSAGQPVGSVMTIRVVIGLVAAFPSVATVRQSNSWMVAYSEGALFGGRDVWVRTVFPTGAQSAPALVATGSLTTRPDIGGESIIDPTASEALVVWTDSTNGVWAAQVTPGTTSTLGSAPTPFDHTNLMSGTNFRNARISKSGGGPGRWAIVAERFLTAPDHTDLRYVIVDWELGLIGGPFFIAVLGVHLRNPDVDGSGSQFQIVYERENPAGNYQIHQRFFGTDGIATMTGSILQFPFTNEHDATVAFTGDRFLVAYNRESLTTPTGLTVVHICASSERVCSGLDGGSDPDLMPAFAARFAGDAGDTSDEGLLAWKADAASPSIQVRPADGTVLGSYSGQGGGCGASVTAAPRGEWVLGNTQFGFDVSVSDAGATLGIMNVRVRGASLAGFNTGALFSCGGCTLMAETGTLLYFPIAGGVGSLDVPIPGTTATLLTKVAFQVFALPTAASPCAAIANVSASERVHFVLGS